MSRAVIREATQRIRRDRHLSAAKFEDIFGTEIRGGPPGRGPPRVPAERSDHHDRTEFPHDTRLARDPASDRSGDDPEVAPAPHSARARRARHSRSAADRRRRLRLRPERRGAVASADQSGVEFQYVTVRAGESLWSLAEELAPESDPRDVVDDILSLNQLPSAGIEPGQRLAVPSQYDVVR
ncbi:LysM peptidoglycan-binding domain-containing protein [Rathayibacter oskolensis]|nr:LysM peptidoglycan-binding domain-containing protein [Rathayibacter oskolensis]WKK71056.1 LysM peptidoglycan-binding domain-containing protein [Rathayibacter oskolensis]